MDVVSNLAKPKAASGEESGTPCRRFCSGYLCRRGLDPIDAAQVRRPLPVTCGQHREGYAPDVPSALCWSGQQFITCSRVLVLKDAMCSVPF